MGADIHSSLNIPIHTMICGIHLRPSIKPKTLVYYPSQTAQNTLQGPRKQETGEQTPIYQLVAALDNHPRGQKDAQCKLERKRKI